MPPVNKVRSGVSFDEATLKALDDRARSLKGLGVDRSEVVNAILDQYFEQSGTTESVWEAVSKRRARLRG